MWRAITLCALVVGWASPSSAGGDVAKGREVAIKYCSRCHVVGDYNRLGGIDSTPSFQLLARRDDVADRVRTFHARPPHPVFVRVPGVARRSNAPAYAAEFTVTPGDIDNLVAFVLSLKNWRRR